MASLRTALLFFVLMMDILTGQSANQTAKLVTESQEMITMTTPSFDADGGDGNSTAFSEEEAVNDTDSDYALMLVNQLRNVVDDLQSPQLTEGEFLMAYQNVSILKTEIDSYLIDELSNATALQYSEINADFYNITNRECPDYQEVEENVESCIKKTAGLETAYERGDLVFCRLWHSRDMCLTKVNAALNCTSRLLATVTNRNSQRANFSELCPRKCSDLIGSSDRCIKLDTEIRNNEKNVTYVRDKCGSPMTSRCLNLSVAEPCWSLWSYVQSQHPGFVRGIEDLCRPKAAVEESVTSQLPTYNQSVAVETTEKTTPSTVETLMTTEESTQTTLRITPTTTTIKLETPGTKGPGTWQRPFNWVPCKEDEKATGGGAVFDGRTAWYLMMGWAFLHVVMIVK